MADMAVARVPFQYGPKWRDRGEVIQLDPNAKNNEKLFGLRYILPFDPKEHKQLLCDSCGRRFSSEVFFEAHKRKANCDDEGEGMSKREFADLIGADPEKVVMEI